MPKHIRTTGRIHPSWLQLGGDQAIARAVIAAGDKTARSNLGALYDDYLPAQFFKELLS